MADEQTEITTNSIELATELTIAWLNNPNVHPSTDDALAFLRSMRGEIETMAKAPEAPVVEAALEYVPAVSVRASIKPDHLVSLIDGKKYKSLKRHLSANGLTPADYRQRYGLKPDYPMVAESYSAARREVALKAGLGQKGRAARAKAAIEAPAAVEAVAAPEAVAVPAKPARVPAKVKAKAKSAAPRATKALSSAKVEIVGEAKPAKRGGGAKAVAAPTVDQADAPKRGWWKKSAEAPPVADAPPAPVKRATRKLSLFNKPAEAPAVEATAVPAKRARAKKAPVEA